jgi:hypothetical protein|tara:strand:- start:215 stop:445 length:231 start_codon:yes stop_codon:yes gene_type:complete
MTNFKISVTVTEEQLNLLTDALFQYSENNDVGNRVEELEDVIDQGTTKVEKPKLELQQPPRRIANSTDNLGGYHYG